MGDYLDRTRMLLGDKAIGKLSASKVAIFGIGGVGGYVAETLARSGIGSFLLVDNDKVSESNINRQIIATTKTVGQYKVEAMKERILDINPKAEVEIHTCFYLPETADKFDLGQFSYVVDAVDTVSAKLELVVQADKTGTPIISSMGAGNKLDPTAFEVADIYETSVCPLAKVMRRELKKLGIEKLKVVYSKEEPIKNLGSDDESPKRTPGSVAFVPSVVGLIMAGEVIKDLTLANLSDKKE